MNRDHRIYRRSTLLQLGINEDIIDGLEVTTPEGTKDDRFQLLTDGLQLPACSFVSRTIDDVWFIDTGVEYDDGRMYIGERDFSGMASVAGYVPKSSVSRIHEENERLKNDLAIARNLIGDLRSAVAGLVGATPMEGNTPTRARQHQVRDGIETLGDSADSSDLDFDAL